MPKHMGRLYKAGLSREDARSIAQEMTGRPKEITEIEVSAEAFRGTASELDGWSSFEGGWMHDDGTIVLERQADAPDGYVWAESAASVPDDAKDIETTDEGTAYYLPGNAEQEPDSLAE